MGLRYSGIWTAVALATVGACYDSKTVDCPDGRVCPAGTVCTSGGCATIEQIDACQGKANGTECEVFSTTGFCRDEVCYPSSCGDGVISGSEQCDGDNFSGQRNCQELGYYDASPLTCSAQCTLDKSTCTGFCGDGVTNGPEQCDGAATTTCQDRGFTNGSAVSCGPTCAWDVSGCS